VAVCCGVQCLAELYSLAVCCMQCAALPCVLQSCVLVMSRMREVVCCSVLQWTVVNCSGYPCLERKVQVIVWTRGYLRSWQQKY